MEAVQQTIGHSVILLGILAVLFGVYAVLRLNSFYARMVISSKVEAMGFVTIIFGAMILEGFSIVTAKLFVILLFELLTVAAGAHAIARSAWKSGYHLPPVQAPEAHDD